MVSTTPEEFDLKEVDFLIDRVTKYEEAPPWEKECYRYDGDSFEAKVFSRLRTLYVHAFNRGREARIDSDLHRLKPQVNIGVVASSIADKVAVELVDREIERLHRLKADLFG